jgi:hypothetical protein
VPIPGPSHPDPTNAERGVVKDHERLAPGRLDACSSGRSTGGSSTTGASVAPDGTPWSARKAYVWWDPKQEKWIEHDVPDFAPRRPWTTSCPRARATCRRCPGPISSVPEAAPETG